MIKRLTTRDPDFTQQLAALLAFENAQDEGIERAVAEILAAVRTVGDAAVLEYTRRFDHLDAKAMVELELPRRELEAALFNLPAEQREALEQAATRIALYHQKQLAASWEYTESDGTRLGQKVTPLDRVGLYVPGGKAAYPSSVLMNAIPAKVAGVGELIMTVPTPRGEKNALVLAAAALAGVDRVFTLGGAQAVGALAYGTQTIPQVDKIVGPGNAFVAAAKRKVFGRVGIDAIAGPSEVVIIADAAADPRLVAIDLLAQAEHDEVAQAILITPDTSLADHVAQAVAADLATLPRAAIAAASWRDHGAIITVRSLAEAAELANALAPEHLELMLVQPDLLMPMIRHAGAVFLGAHSPEALGDYVAGPNHVLPTARTARFASGLSVFDFLKRTTWLEASPSGLAAIGPAAALLADAEGLSAHARSIRRRLGAA